MITKFLILLFALPTTLVIGKNVDLDEFLEEQVSVYNNVFKEDILPKIAENIQRNKRQDSSKCSKDISLVTESLNSTWALNMIDANGRLPSGILRGNRYNLGQFDQCLAITHEHTGKDFQGKYCPMDIVVKNLISTLIITGEQMFPNSTISDSLPDTEILEKFGLPIIVLGICVPSSCRAQDIQFLIEDLLESNGINFTKPLVRLFETSCFIKEPIKYTGGDVTAIVIFSIFALILVMSTVYDLILKKYYKVTDLNKRDSILTSFSMYTNSEKLLKVNNSSGNLKCLHGIRVLSIFWVILGHRYEKSFKYPLENLVVVYKWIEYLPAYLIISATFAVDTFFVLSGTLLSYVFFTQRFNLGLFYLHRFIRLWPAMAAIVLFQGTLYYYIGNGPLWSRLSVNRRNCAETWWSSLLYIQNYVNPQKMCVGHLWYLAIDTQLYILSPLLIYPLLKNIKLGLANLLFWTTVALSICVTIAYMNNWGGVNNLDDESYWKIFYHQTHTRCHVWFVGFGTGYLIYRCKRVTFRMNNSFVIIGWIISLVILSTILFGAKPMTQLDHVINKLEDSTYTAFSKFGWGIGVSWVIFACVMGYGGPINWFLSLPFWEVLGRLSYSMYLVHLCVIYLITASSRIVRNFSHLDMLYLYFGDVATTCFISFIWVLAFESPFLNLEKILIKRKKPRTALLENSSTVSEIEDAKK